MNDQELDQLLKMPLLEVPQDFEQQVLKRIERLPSAVSLASSSARMLQSAPSSGWPSQYRDGLKWLTLITGSGLALSQLLGFVFGLWLTTNAH